MNQLVERLTKKGNGRNTGPGDSFVSRFSMDTKAACWNWKGPVDSQGYGCHGSVKTPNGKRTYGKAHRISYESFVGEIPEGLHVLHACDNPSCVNPSHLRTGTNQDNIADVVKRKRRAGERHSMAILRNNEVLAIKKCLRHYKPRDGRIQFLASWFNVSRATIYQIKHNNIWREMT